MTDTAERLRFVIAANIRAERARAQIGQEDIAACMSSDGYDWHRQTVGQIENGRRRVTAEELVSLADVLGVPVSRLLP